jgi:hypothetical protein
MTNRFEKDNKHSSDDNDGSVDSRTATDDKSLGDFQSSKNFLEEAYALPKNLQQLVQSTRVQVHYYHYLKRK